MLNLELLGKFGKKSLVKRNSNVWVNTCTLWACLRYLLTQEADAMSYIAYYRVSTNSQSSPCIQERKPRTCSKELSVEF